MDDPFARLAELARRVARSVDAGDAEAMQAESRGIQAALAERVQATATATDPSGLVQATVQTDGLVQDVRIGARAIRDLDHAALEQACADAVRAARAAAATEMTAWLTGQPAEGEGQAGRRGPSYGMSDE